MSGPADRQPWDSHVGALSAAAALNHPDDLADSSAMAAAVIDCHQSGTAPARLLDRTVRWSAPSCPVRQPVLPSEGEVDPGGGGGGGGGGAAGAVARR